MKVYIISIILAIIVCVSNKIWKFDPDIGGYTPSLRDKALYPKFYVHSVSGSLLAFALIHFGISILISLPMIFGFGLLYEWSQGFINYLDIVAELYGWLVVSMLMMIH